MQGVYKFQITNIGSIYSILNIFQIMIENVMTAKVIGTTDKFHKIS